MSSRVVAALPYIASLCAVASAQQIGTAIPEVHPRFPTFHCTTDGGCVEKSTFLVTDALARSFHAVDDMDINCAEKPFDPAICPDEATCAQNCALEGIDYASIGVLTRGTSLTMRQYLFDGQEYSRVSPRVYLLAEDEETYEMMKLVNQELSYDVDVSQLACGMNGALYLSEMDPTGSKSATNVAGAAYGTGYCDAQCFDVPWINGLPNMNSSGACCNEMDIWEANSRATVYTPHTCSGVGSFLCAGDDCTATGVCDKAGCGINPFRSGFDDYYAPGGDVDTSKPFTVVTQFISDDGTATGTLSEIRRLYVQDGKVLENHPISTDATEPGFLTEEFCTDHNAEHFLRLGGMKVMGESLQRGMVLIFSIWNSDGDFMSWLDSGESGPCLEGEGDPKKILMARPDVSVTFSNVRWGDIGSTFDSAGAKQVPGLVSAAPAMEQPGAAGDSSPAAVTTAAAGSFAPSVTVGLLALAAAALL